MGTNNNHQTIRTLVDVIDLFHNYTGKRPTKLVLPRELYQSLVEDMQFFAGNMGEDVFEFEGCQVSCCTGILRHVGGENEQGTGIGSPIERVNEELRIS